MARRNLLHRSKLEDFKFWLEENGQEILPTKGDFEVLRWKNGKNPMAIIFNCQSTDHFSCNEVSISFVRKFIKQSRTDKNEQR